MPVRHVPPFDREARDKRERDKHERDVHVRDIHERELRSADCPVALRVTPEPGEDR